MAKTLYTKYQYFFNLLTTRFLLTIISILDIFAWSSAFPGRTKYILLTQLFEFISYLPFLLLLIYSYLWAIKRKSTILIFSLIILFSVLGVIPVRILTISFEHIFWPKIADHLSFDLILKITPGGIISFLTLSAVFYLTYTRLQFIQQKDATIKAETLAKDVQLKMLRYQINPHFLFNVLNSLHALIDENTGKAKKLVVEMSEYYRYTLNKQQQTSSLESEVDAVRKYLEIQKMRFEEKFEYEIFFDEAAKTALIPSFIIHLLIENAVKYGVKSNGEKLSIRLAIKMFNKALFIRVSNTGKLLPSNNHTSDKNIEGTGNGIENIKNRLALFYNDNYSFSLTEENGWVIAAIEIKNIPV